MVLMMAMEASAWMWKKRNFSASNKHFSACQHDSWQEQSLAEDSSSAWMWKNRNFSASNKHFSACQHDSWHEQSLAEDSSELLCECTWPPRYYSCSFCRKEFKSAQALGGHMNVHRRDRARLRQSPNSQSEVEQHSRGFLDAHQHPPGVCSMVILNPNSRPEHSSPPSAVSSYESSKHTFSQHSSYQEPPLCDPLSKISSEFTAVGDSKFRNNLTCDVAWQELAIGSPDWLLGRRKMDEELLGSCDDETTAKRKRPRNCSTGYSRENAPSDLLYFQSNESIVEDLDLELRLGVSSKVD